MRFTQCILLAAILLLGVGWWATTQLLAVDSKETQAAAAVADLTPNQPGVDWPRFLGPNADSSSPETGLITPWPEEGLEILWTLPLGEGYAAPTIYRGRLLVFDRNDNTARLRCLHEQTREELWTFEYPTSYVDKYGYNGGPRCCPVCDGDRVYIQGPEGMLHCLRLADGSVLWKVDQEKEFGIVQNFFGVGSTPVVYGDLLILHVGGSPPGSDQLRFEDVKPNGTGIVAFDKLTGEVRYKVGDELASYSTPVITKVNGNDYGLAFTRGGLLGFAPESGKQRFFFPWRADILESVNAANPVVAADKVLISETYGPGAACLKLGANDFEVLWQDQPRQRQKALQAHWCTPIVHEGYVYGCSGRHTQNADLRCIELATGKVMWTEPNTTRCSLLKVDGHLISLGEYGELRLLKLNPEKYDEVSRVWYRKPEGREIAGFGKEPLIAYPAWAAPVLSHGRLYLRGEGILVGLQAMKADEKP